MLQDTQVKVILTCESLQASLPNHNAIVVCLDKDWQQINQASQQNLNSTVSADNLAYVIDGVNADDLRDYRPGIQAARERGARSPLAEIGITKSEALFQQNLIQVLYQRIH